VAVKRITKGQSKGASSAKVPTFLRRGDPVMVIAGGNRVKRPLKGKVSKILAIGGQRGDRVMLDGLNLFTRHKRARQQGEVGEKVQVQRSVHISNVMYYVESISRPVRLVKGVSPEGKRVRGYKDPTSGQFVQI
jgi:large subunit ribosomal protein L24